MPSLFRPALALLTQYAAYHRDRRNIATHYVGVPLIVLGIGVLLARPVWHAAGWLVTPAWLLFAASAAWYLTRGRLGLALVTVVCNGVLMLLAHHLSASSDNSLWLAWGLGSFVLGWVIQFIGHYYEGRKPAFTDDLVGLLVAPMFVVLELLAPLGFFKQLTNEIAAQVGPTRIRDLAQPAAR